MDRYFKNPEAFLRKSPEHKRGSSYDTMHAYKAKTGHDSRYGKARLSARIQDTTTEMEMGLTEDKSSPVLVASSRADKRFDHDRHSNAVNMNRAYKRRLLGRAHYNDIDKESVLPDVSRGDTSFRLKKHFTRAGHDRSEKSNDYNGAMPFLNDNVNKEAEMDLSDQLMENRAYATQHRGRDPTDDANTSQVNKKLENERHNQQKLSHLKQAKQKQYLKKMELAWDELKRKGKGKDALFPELDAEGQTDDTVTSNGQTTQGSEGGNMSES